MSISYVGNPHTIGPTKNSRCTASIASWPCFFPPWRVREPTKKGSNYHSPHSSRSCQGIREVAIIYPPGTLAHRKDHITLSRMSPRQLKLANCLQIQEALGR